MFWLFSGTEEETVWERFQLVIAEQREGETSSGQHHDTRL